MTLPSQIAHYKITGKLGEGGMGAVYRATDTKLNRDVAIKVLPGEFAHDAERLARLTREAQVLAALNHPNIATVYGIEGHAIVMELVEGGVLAGPLPIDTALNYASQIAEALDAAHEKGVTHRDLKPANIKVTPQGVVKVLDFGLAKMVGPTAATASANAMSSPTVTLHSQAGMIMGTAAYMSPEHARGQAVDKRADIWAFGVVLWEMLTGRRMFEGDTISDVLAAVLKHEPNLDAVPEQVRPLIAACLQKDPRKRLRDIGDWRALLDEQAEPPQPQVRTGRLPWIAAALLAAVVAAGMWFRAPRTPAQPVLRFTHDLGPDIKLHDVFSGPTPYTGPNVVISPDGERIAFVASKPGQPIRLYTRRLDSTAVGVIAASDWANTPFFSPDGRWIGFFARGKMKKANVDGGAPQDICPGIDPMGAAWSDNGSIIVSFGLNSGLSIVPATGGMPQPLTKTAPPEVTTHRWPQALPGGRAVLFSMGRGSLMDDGSLVVYNLDSGTTKVVRKGAGFGRYLPDGRIVFLSKGTLFAAPFDLGRFEIAGEAIPVLQDVKHAPDSGGAQLSISRTGMLLYRAQTSMSELSVEVVNEGGASTRLPFPLGPWRIPAVSPDGRKIALLKGEPGDQQIWVSDLTGDKQIRISYEGGDLAGPSWTPDGSGLLYAVGRGADRDRLYMAPSDGSRRAALLTKVSNGPMRVIGLTPDEKQVLYLTGAGAFSECYAAPLEGGLRNPRLGAALPCSTEPVGSTEISPDGKWLAYTAVESGRSQVYVRRFPDNGVKWQVSLNGGSRPAWSPTGDKLFFAGLEELMVAPYSVKGGVFLIGTRKRWSDLPLEFAGTSERQFSVMPDGKRVVVFALGGASTAEASQVDVIVNFSALIDRALTESKR
jgi:serine/threonine-protein kinase